MKIRNLLAFTLLSIPFVVSADATSEVRDTYNGLDEAILAGDGDAAYAMLSADSQKMIETARKLALNADKATLTQESIPIILSVFSIRTEAQGNPPMNGPETLLLMSADYEKTSSMSSIGDVTVDGDKATAALLMNGQPSGMDFSFVKEDGTWKIDMVQQLADTEEMMMESLQGSGMSRDMIINQMAMAARSEGVDVWQPLN